MSLLGQTRQDLPFTVCDKFQPTVLDGQLCYSLDLTNVHSGKTKPGLKNGIFLLLDSGIQNVGEDVRSNSEDKIVSMNLEPSFSSGGKFKIYLNTLDSFTDFRTGTYAMSSLKKTTGTDSFLDLPNAKKRCQIERFEKCAMQKYKEQLEKQCGCVPWALGNALKVKVPNSNNSNCEN